MKIAMLVLAFVVAWVFRIPSVEAFECPAHFKEAQAEIDKAGAALKSLKKGSSLYKIVHAANDDAKMYLHGAKHNHEKPQGEFDHARAIAKADLAKAYAQMALENAKK